VDAWHKMVRKFAQNRRRPVVSALQLSTCLCDGVIIVLKVVVFFFFYMRKIIESYFDEIEIDIKTVPFRQNQICVHARST
jgi:hypothetical protein